MRPRMTRTLRIATTITIILLAVTLRLIHIRDRALDNDEVAETMWSSFEFDKMMSEVRRDAVHPPADYLVQFVVGRVGPEWVRRLPSVLTGTATVALLILLGTQWMSWRAGIAAGFLLAISPMHIFYSQQVRPYATALCWLIASLVALEWYARTRRTRWAVAWAAFVWLAGATLYFGGMVAAIGGFTRIFIDRRDVMRSLWRRLPLVIIVWTLLYAPWLQVIRNASRIASPAPPATFDWPWWEWRLQSLGAGSERTWEAVDLGSWAFWLLVVIGIVASVRVRLLRVAAVMFVFGSIAEVALLQIHPHYPAVRYLMPPWIAGFLLAGGAVVWLGRHFATRPVAIAAMITFAGFAAIRIDEYYRGDRSDWRAIAEYVHARIKPGDTLVVTSTWTIRNFGHYWHSLAPIDRLTIEVYAPAQRELAGPAWIVIGGCMKGDARRAAPLMATFPRTEQAEVRYLRPGQKMSMREPICPD
jgi:hypothetical protein